MHFFELGCYRISWRLRARAQIEAAVVLSIVFLGKSVRRRFLRFRCCMARHRSIPARFLRRSAINRFAPRVLKTPSQTSSEAPVEATVRLVRHGVIVGPPGADVPEEITHDLPTKRCTSISP